MGIWGIIGVVSVNGERGADADLKLVAIAMEEARREWTASSSSSVPNGSELRLIAE